jgi:Flp pilus assembly protein TadD
MSFRHTSIAIAAPLVICLAFLASALLGAASSQKPSTQHFPNPDRDLQTLLAAGASAIESKDFAAAVTAYRKYLDQRPGDAVAHFQLGYAYSGLQRLDDAREEYRKAAELNPKMPEAQLNYGLALLEKDPAAAVEPLRRAAELLPGKAQPHFALGLALERSGQPEPAIEQYQQAETLDAKTYDIHFALGRTLLSLQRAPEAEKEFREALALKPDSDHARLGFAESLLAQQKLEVAAPELAAYLKSVPGDSATRLQYASVLTDLGKNDEALAQLNLAGSNALDSAAGLKMRADLLVRQKKFAEAVPYLQKAVALAPRDPDLRQQFGAALLEQKKFADAAREFAAALQIDSRHTAALRGLVFANYFGENCTAALSLLDRLASLEAPTDRTRFLRADCYDKLGQKAEALEAYDKYLSLHTATNDDEFFAATARVRALERQVKRKKP